MAEELVPGFYQGRERQRGIKTGRVAPRDAVRPTAWAHMQNDQHLEPHHPNQVWSETNDQYDPNQGALFDVNKVAPRTNTPESDIARARELGAPTGRISVNSGKQEIGLAGQPGFFPDLNRKQKVLAINNLGKARTETGAAQGGAHFGEMQLSRERAAARGKAALGGEANWYAGVDSEGRHDGSIGAAPAAIQNVAGQLGTSTHAVTRGVAIQSPQMTWQDDQTGDMPNLAATRGVYTAVQSAQRKNPDIGVEAIRDIGVQNAGMSLPLMAAKSADNFHTHGEKASTPFPVQDVKSQKAPNFEAALHMSHIDPAVRRIASQAWTVDRHDAAITGVDRDTGLAKRGALEAVALSGRRATLKHNMGEKQAGRRANRSLSDEQALEWVGQRDGGDLPRLFDPDTHTMRRSALPPAAAPASSRLMARDHRSPIAQKYDLDF